VFKGVYESNEVNELASVNFLFDTSQSNSRFNAEAV